ncbi:MAG: hypothetical protein P4L99_02935 [Chthoniobacter sp.]|nr:hypothetical protein [Chthoniobacter sp.]
MTAKPIRPLKRDLPAGLVDAIGLDDAAVPFRPYVLKPKGEGLKESGRENSNAQAVKFKRETGA